MLITLRTQYTDPTRGKHSEHSKQRRGRVRGTARAEQGTLPQPSHPEGAILVLTGKKRKHMTEQEESINLSNFGKKVRETYTVGCPRRVTTAPVRTRQPANDQNATKTASHNEQQSHITRNSGLGRFQPFHEANKDHVSPSYSTVTMLLSLQYSC